MVKKIFILLIWVLQVWCMYAQKERTQNWVIGDSVTLHFDSVNNTVSTSFNLPMYSLEGVSVFNDRNGNVKYYCNGEYLYNTAGQKFKVDGNISMSQSSVFIEKPGDTNMVLLFVINAGKDNNLTYYLIDNRLNNGKGGITEKRIIQKNTSEKIAVTRHANKKDSWVLIHSLTEAIYYAYKVDSTLDFPVYESKFGHYESPGFFGGNGCLKFSPSSNLVASANGYFRLIEFSLFDNKIGKLFHLFDLKTIYTPYGIEFSTDETKLYVSDANSLFQFDLESGEKNSIKNSMLQLDKHFMATGQLQLALDGKIYVAKLNRNSIGVIQYPNNEGELCFFDSSSVYLNERKSKGGLPNFPSHFFYDSAVVKKINFIADTSDTAGITSVSDMNAFPTAFTPNNDGLNDCYYIDLYKPVKRFMVQVFNRWGVCVYSSNNEKFCWDGLDIRNNNPLQMGVYHLKFYIEFQDSSIIDSSININLIR